MNFKWFLSAVIRDVEPLDHLVGPVPEGDLGDAGHAGDVLLRPAFVAHLR